MTYRLARGEDERRAELATLSAEESGESTVAQVPIRQSGRNGNLLNAEIAAREIGDLSLGNALEYCLLLSDVGASSSMNRSSQRKPRSLVAGRSRFWQEARAVRARRRETVRAFL